METGRWANTHHAESAKVLGPLTGIEPATFATMARSEYGDSLTASMIQPVIDVAVKYGQLKEPPWGGVLTIIVAWGYTK